jgi:hypothetical protein
MRYVTLIMLLIMPLSMLMGYELLKLVDTPTAGILQQGEVQVSAKAYRSNGILAGSSVGILPRFMFGISYGGENLVGSDKPFWHERVEVNAKYRIIDEGTSMPAIAVGFDTQGHGEYHKSLKRFDIKSKGFYAVASKNFLLYGNLGLHGGANYSLEVKDKQDNINFFIGADKTIGENLHLLLDYDLALNDQKAKASVEEESDFWKRRGYGYLNLALYLKFTDFVAVKFLAYDVLENNKLTNGADRAIIIDYNMKF